MHNKKLLQLLLTPVLLQSLQNSQSSTFVMETHAFVWLFIILICLLAYITTMSPMNCSMLAFLESSKQYVLSCCAENTVL